MRTIIFEDNNTNLNDIVFLLNKYVPDWPIVGIGSNINDCKLLLKNTACDLLISDIHFGNEIIFDELPELIHFKGKILFISGDNNFANEAFEMSAVHYLLKPIDETHFLKAIKRLSLITNSQNSVEVLINNLENRLSANKKFSFYTKEGFLIRKVVEILFLKADNNYTEIHFIDGKKILIPKTIMYYERLLLGFNFFRVHQSYIVNLEHIMLYDKDNNYLKLNQGFEIQVSTRKKSELMDMLNKVF